MVHNSFVEARNVLDFACMSPRVIQCESHCCVKTDITCGTAQGNTCAANPSSKAHAEKLHVQCQQLLGHACVARGYKSYSA